METGLKNKAPVAVIDSGMGGLSVLKVLRRLMPNENYIYFGDSANAPYGEKSGEEVRRITGENIEMLISRGAKAVVIACNTATSAAAEYVRAEYPHIPIIGMEPAVKPAARSGEHPTVLVMATPLTLERDKFKKLMDKYSSEAELIKVPCHGLVELVEEGICEGEKMEECLRGILSPYTSDRNIDAVVLGCTHYIHAAETIKKVVCGAEIFDGADGTARETKRRLAEAGILNTSDDEGEVIILNSSNDESFIERSKALLERE